jgi:mlo protein
MLLGFISLFLTITQNGITKICVPDEWTYHMLPCSLEEIEEEEMKKNSHFQTFFSSDHVSGTARRLLGGGGGGGSDDPFGFTDEKVGYCTAKVLKLCLLSLTL